MRDNLETVRIYLERAKAAGAEAEAVQEGAWIGRLETLLRELGARKVALPASGWPDGVRETIEGVLAGFGCTTVSPEASVEGFSWDRGELAQADLGITWCRAFIAATGSLAFPSGPGLGTGASLLPFVHLTVGRAESVYSDLAAYLAEVGARLPSRLTLVTGPSRTGDIEGTMNTGVHGPGRVIQWVLSDRS